MAKKSVKIQEIRELMVEVRYFIAGTTDIDIFLPISYKIHRFYKKNNSGRQVFGIMLNWEFLWQELRFH
jgi:hypothetical protein